MCGNGIVEQGEVCDDGNTADGDQCRGDCGQDYTLCGNQAIDPGEGCDNGTANSAQPDAACRPDCQPRRCGDGIIDPFFDEVCDSGVTTGVSPDPCKNDCTWNTCGDSYVGESEECDLGATNGLSPAECKADCTHNSCGDGYIGGTEGCDDGAANSDSAPDACRTDCVPAHCGDAIIDAAEQCDGANIGVSTCADYGYANGGTLSCAACELSSAA